MRTRPRIPQQTKAALSVRVLHSFNENEAQAETQLSKTNAEKEKTLHQETAKQGL
jgi:hypothetical protein